MALTSVDSPKPGASERGPFEGMEALAALQPRELKDGNIGSADATSSRAAVRFLVKGTSKEPLRPPVSIFESLLTDVDRRKQIFETELAPWRMICSLEITSHSGALYVGTGWFVGPRTLVTAGHCVYDPVELGGWAQSIVVIPGRDDDEEPFQRVTSKSFSTTNAWLQSQDPDFDYAAIHLEKDFGTEIGTFGLGVLPDADLANRLVNVSGYPVSPGNGRRQYFHANRVKAVTSRRVFYDVDTMGGQSGSPVWAYLDGSDKPTAVGIHAYGIGGVPANLGGLVANSGPRILPEVMDLIKAWIAKGQD